MQSPPPLSPPAGISSIVSESGFSRRPSTTFLTPGSVASASIAASRISNGATTHIVFEYGGEFVAGVHAAGLLFDGIKELSLKAVEDGTAEGWVQLKKASPGEAVETKPAAVLVAKKKRAGKGGRRPQSKGKQHIRKDVDTGSAKDESRSEEVVVGVASLLAEGTVGGMT